MRLGSICQYSSILDPGIQEGIKKNFWEKISKLDFSQINKKLMTEDPQKWTLELLAKAEELYRSFLLLHALYPEKELVPTVLIDEYWHQHILDTRSYAKDCEFIFGYFLHHDPYFGIYGEKDKAENLKVFEETKLYWEATFGETLLGSANPCKATDCR